MSKVQRNMRNSEAKRQRLIMKAQGLSDQDLLEVIAMRTRAKGVYVCRSSCRLALQHGDQCSDVWTNVPNQPDQPHTHMPAHLPPLAWFHELHRGSRATMRRCDDVCACLATNSNCIHTHTWKNVLELMCPHLARPFCTHSGWSLKCSCWVYS